MVGNFIADSVKGKKFRDYEKEISGGILMHREIDSFTDTHEIVKHSKSFFRTRYGLYSSVIIDLVYDHFLSANWNSFSDLPLYKQILTKYKGSIYTVEARKRFRELRGDEAN